MNRLFNCLALACALFANSSFAKDVPAPVAAAIAKGLERNNLVRAKVDEVRATPVDGLYEVRVGSELYYSNKQGTHLVHGQMYEGGATPRNLTQARLDTLTAIEFDKLPFADAFKVVRGNGKRQLAVFEDPNCGYCKKLEPDLQALNDVTIHYFLYPILSPDSMQKSVAVWCSSKPEQAWTGWVLGDKPPVADKGSCEVAAISRNLELGRKLRINATPTLIFGDGKRIPGAIGLPQLEQMLTRVSEAPTR